MVHKAGAVFQKRMSDFFDRENSAHLRAWAYKQERHHWPAGFPGKDVFENPSWEEDVGDPFEGRTLPPEVDIWIAEWKRLDACVAPLEYLDFYFLIEPIGEEFYVSVRSGLFPQFESRRWFIRSGEHVLSVVKTCRLAVMEVLSNQVMKHFTQRLLDAADKKLD